jgi:hypothetical protein
VINIENCRKKSKENGCQISNDLLSQPTVLHGLDRCGKKIHIDGVRVRIWQFADKPEEREKQRQSFSVKNKINATAHLASQVMASNKPC